MVDSLFDTPRFNESLFFPRGDSHPGPPGSHDLWVAVSGARLHLRHHPAPGAETFLLVFHGNGEVVSDYDEWAASLARRSPTSALVCDYRGYGLSTGAPTLGLALDDAHAVLAAAVALRDQRAPRAKLVVLGRSLGGHCAIALCAEPSLSGLVLESAGYDLAALVARRGLPPETPFTEAERARFDPAVKLLRARHPTLVVHGTRDTIIHYGEAEACAARLGPAATLAPVAGAGHNDLWSWPGYWQALTAFLQRIAG